MPAINTEIDITKEVLSRSQTEINDLIGNPPSWLLRSGIMMVAIVTGVILSGAYFFNYPDKLSGVGKLTSTTPPIEIISRATGYIDKIHIAENEYVNKGDAILYISNTTDENQLEILQSWILEYERIIDPRQYLDLNYEKGLHLGAIQGDYAGLQLRYNELQQTLKDDLVFQQINNICREVEKIKKLNDSQRKEKGIFKNELALTKKDYQRNEQLNVDGVISNLNLEGSKMSLLQKERQYVSMDNSIIQNIIRIEQLELEKLKLREQRSNTIKNYQFSIAEVIARLRASVTNWTQTYTVEAPISGNMIYTLNISKQKNLKQGETIGHIIPKTADKNYVSAIFPIGNIGKIENGQKAIIRFDAYPYKEFGSVVGKVESVGRVPSIDENGQVVYEVKIPLENVIVTDYAYTITHKPSMTAQIQIITQDKTVFQRVFNQLVSITKS